MVSTCLTNWRSWVLVLSLWTLHVLSMFTRFFAQSTSWINFTVSIIDVKVSDVLLGFTLSVSSVLGKLWFHSKIRSETLALYLSVCSRNKPRCSVSSNTGLHCAHICIQYKVMQTSFIFLGRFEGNCIKEEEKNSNRILF